MKKDIYHYSKASAKDRDPGTSKGRSNPKKEINNIMDEEEMNNTQFSFFTDLSEYNLHYSEKE